jgi:pimeloyl-ACP methyl ester carboxylesterase
VIAALAYPHAQPATAMRRQIEAFKRFDPARLRAAPPAPTLVLLAEQDLLMPRPMIEPVLAEMGDLRIETLPDAGHSLHWDAPEAFAARVATFIGSLPSRD